eukprot:6468513-Karenia_brevis.AAC.1
MSRKERVRIKDRPKAKERATGTSGRISRLNNGITNGTIRIREVIRTTNKTISGLANGRINRLGKAM